MSTGITNARLGGEDQKKADESGASGLKPDSENKREYLRMLQEERAAGTPTERNPTFLELLEWYIARRKLKKSTVAHMNPLRSLPLRDQQRVTRTDVQDYIDELSIDHRPSTVLLHFRQIRAVFRYAISRERYPYQDPTMGIDLPKNTGPRQRYLNPEETKKLLNTVKDEPRIYLFVKMALCTGARLGTLLTVRAEDVHPDGSVTLINHKVNGRKYTGFFDEETMRLVAGKHGYVLALPGKEDKQPARQSIQYRVQRVLNDLFNPPGTAHEERAVVHSLRHSVGTQMVRKGVPLEVISKTLDHSSIAVTSAVYAKVVPDLIKKATHHLWD